MSLKQLPILLLGQMVQSNQLVGASDVVISFIANAAYFLVLEDKHKALYDALVPTLALSLHGTLDVRYS